MSIKDFTVKLEDLSFYGEGLVRAESVLAYPDGSLRVSDGRGGYTTIHPDGAQSLTVGFDGEPNGLTADHDGNLYVANIATGVIHKQTPDGAIHVVLDQWEGQALGSSNYVHVDSKNRLWIGISSRHIPWFIAVAGGISDGYIILLDDKGARIVADNIGFVNEIRMDADEKYLYVAETMGRRMLRYPVLEDGLGEKEVYGPEILGELDFPDGFAIDAEGNLWIVSILRNALMILTPDGDVHNVFADPQPEALKVASEGLANGTLTPEAMFACVGKTLQFPASIAFGGEDLKTVYMGSLAMPHLVTFRSPVAGLPMRHW